MFSTSRPQGGQRPWLPLLVLALAWLLVSLAAMLGYAERHHFGWSMLWPHFAIVFSLLALLVAACLGVACLPLNPVPRRVLLVAVLAGAHGLLLVCYAIFFFSWEAWNQAASVNVVAAYVPQLLQLVRALPVSPGLAICAAVLSLALVVMPYALASAALLRSLTWAARAIVAWYLSWTRVWRLCVLVATVLVLPALLTHAAWSGRNAAARLNEPFFQAFLEPGKEIGSMRLDATAVLRADRERAIAASYPATQSIRKKNLILITVDALRADQMSVYGFSRRTTPFLDSLHREGRLSRIDRAYSVCTETFCGLLGVLTSKYWHQTTLHSFGLADVLKRLGYRVTYLLSGDHTNFYGQRSAYGDSIDAYRDGSTADGYINDDDNVLGWLRQFTPQAGVPQFLFMHLMSVHTLGLRHAPYRRWEPAEVGLRSLRAEQMIPAYVNNYHNGVLQADAVIERIFGQLRDKGLLDNAIVVITADHGEMLGEQGRLGHSRHELLDPLVRVPLLIYDSEGVRYPIRPMASQVDVAPTLLHRIGAQVPDGWAGEALDEAAKREFIAMQAGGSRGVVMSARGELWKYIVDEPSGTERLFNLGRDPHEVSDVLAQADPASAVRVRAAFRIAFSGVAPPQGK